MSESAFALRVSDLLWRQYFEGDKAVQVGVAGFVDHSHPTFIQFLENLIPAIVLPKHDQPDCD